MRWRCIEVAVHVKGHLGWLSDPAGRNRVKPMQASKVTMIGSCALSVGPGSNARACCPRVVHLHGDRDLIQIILRCSRKP